MLQNIWDLAIKLLEVIGSVWDWLNNPLTINLTWLKIPLIFPDGIQISTGIVPLAIFGSGIFLFLMLWLVKGLVPAS